MKLKKWHVEEMLGWEAVFLTIYEARGSYRGAAYKKVHMNDIRSSVSDKHLPIINYANDLHTIPKTIPISENIDLSLTVF